MKKLSIILIVILCSLTLAACSGNSSSFQSITFQGITMQIPNNWKAEKSTLSDNYAVFEKKNLKGHDYKLQFTDTFSLLESFNGDLEKAGDFFKEVTEDDASYLNPSDPIPGKFAGKYDMHMIDCVYSVINPSKGGKAEYPCKLLRIYMEGHDIKIQFSSEKGDFKTFDTAIAGAVCE